MTVIGPVLLLATLLLLLSPVVDAALVALPLMPSVSPLHAGIIHAVNMTAPAAKTNPIDLVLIDITSRQKPYRRAEHASRAA